MRVLVTGSRGVIGRDLVKTLGRSYEVFGCDIQHAPLPQDEFMRADVADFRQLSRVFSAGTPEVCVHLAAEFGRHNGEGWYENLWRTNLIGTRNVLELCHAYEVPLIFASTSEVYGEHSGVRDTQYEYGVLEEDITYRDVILHPNEYALSKWTNERQIEAYALKHPELRYMILRFFNAYGPGEFYHPYRSVVALFCYKALCREPFQVFQGYHRAFMYVDDFIPTLATAVDPKCFHHGEIVNIGGRDFRSVEELANIVKEHIPSAEYKLLGEDEHNTKSKLAGIEKAERLLGHDPARTLEYGIPRTIEWMRSVYGKEPRL